MKLTVTQKMFLLAASALLGILLRVSGISVCISPQNEEQAATAEEMIFSNIDRSHTVGAR